jgi:hypothetical protein
MLIHKNIFAVAKICDRTSSRYALGAVEFSREKDGSPLAVATDGRRLVAVTWPEADGAKYPAPEGFDLAHKPEFSTLIPAADCDKLARVKLAKITTVKPILANIAMAEPSANGVVPMMVNDLETVQRFDVKSMEGKFPRWRDCVPRYDRPISICVDGKFLADILEVALKVAGDSDNRRVTLTLDADNKAHERPLIVSAANCNGRTFGLLMPVCGKDDKSNKPPVPEWIPGYTDKQLASIQPFAAGKVAEAADQSADHIDRLRAERDEWKASHDDAMKALREAQAELKAAQTALAETQAALKYETEVSKSRGRELSAMRAVVAESAANAVAAVAAVPLPAEVEAATVPVPAADLPAASKPREAGPRFSTDWRSNGREVAALAYC